MKTIVFFYVIVSDNGEKFRFGHCTIELKKRERVSNGVIEEVERQVDLSLTNEHSTIIGFNYS